MASVAVAAEQGEASRDRYTRGAIWFHWVIAALIVVNLIIGLFHDSFPDALRGASMSFHKAAGITVIFLSVARLAWRLNHRPPPQSRTHKTWERWLAKTTHRLFYVLMIGVPVAGWLFVSASSRPTALDAFGLNLPRLPVPQTDGVSGFWHEAHEIMAFGIIGLLALHIAGALKHQLIDRDNELARIVPGIGRPPAPR